MVNVRFFRLALLVAGDATALVRLPGHAAEFLARAGRPRDWLLEVGVDRALAVAAGAAVWLAAAWLALGLLAVLGARLPGAVGRLGAAVGRRVLPRALLGLVAGTAGIGVLLAPVAAGADPAPGPTPTVSAPTWPTDPSVSAEPAAPAPAAAPTWPTSTSGTNEAGTKTAAPARPHPSRTPSTSSRPTTGEPGTTAAGPLRVRPGDSLWLLTGRRLGPDASDAQIAATWPRWYAANRAVIGADPALIVPGQLLRSPAPTSAPPTREETR